MAETITTTSTSTKQEKYDSLKTQLDALLGDETDVVANMANFCAAVQMVFDHHWVGFYRVVNNEMILGPFQGPVACNRIQKGKGVCGTVWEKNETLVVADVEQFPGHIACSALSKSEIVVPVRKGETCIAVFDIDSDQLNGFDAVDKAGVEQLVSILEKRL